MNHVHCLQSNICKEMGRRIDTTGVRKGGWWRIKEEPFGRQGVGEKKRDDDLREVLMD